MAQEEVFHSADALRQAARECLAPLDGELPLRGVREPVEILRDRWGVPHIYAANRHDLFFAQGFVAAQDRLFQLEVWRRLARGELAELLGPRFAEHDRLARLLRYRGDLQAEWDSYGPDTQQIAESFTAGINAWIDQCAQRPPIEFQILGAAPGKWEPADILGRTSGITMVRNFVYEVLRSELIATRGLEEARRLAPTEPEIPFAPVQGLDLSGLDQSALAPVFALAESLRLDPSDTESNDWVVDGAMSASGKPLLANDPHRGLSLPSLRYLVHLHAPGLHCIGSGEPALPGIALGHNERVAWGFTIVTTDQADLYVEELHPQDDNRYRVGDRWEAVEVVRETLRVRGESSREVELRFTRHGPLLFEDRNRRRAFALRWAGAEPGGAAYLGGLALSRVQNRQEFLRAMAAWKVPSENIVYADVEGNIGWIAAALTPRRSAHDGLLPVPGAEARYEWQGFLTVDELPQAFNPPSHFVLTANHNILPKGLQPVISYEWAQPFRFARLRQHFTAGRRFTLEDFQRMQHDNISLPGQRLAAIARRFQPADETLRQAVALVRNWDGRVECDSAAAAVYGLWLQALVNEFFGPDLTEPMRRFLRGNSGMAVLLEALDNADPRHFGKQSPQQARDALLEKTLRAALEQGRRRLGADVGTWQWGQLHQAHFRHPLGSLGEPYAAVFDRPGLPMPGDGWTPNAAAHNEAFDHVHGSSYRHLFDLADWDRGLATSAPGQSGQPESPFYDNLLPLWQRGEYFPLKFSRSAVEAVTAHRLQLKPAGP